MSSKSNHSVLFLGKRGDEHCSKALEFVRKHFTVVSAHLGEWGDALPEDVGRWKGDYIISYLSRWIVSEQLIRQAKVAAINFHPASPDYPGIGCNNFALYEDAEEYGVTCHHMSAKVDTGNIIAVKRFPVFPTDDVSSLLARTYEFQLELFYEVVGHMLRDEPLPSSEERWTRKPFSREAFNELSVIKPTMAAEEVEKRVRATSYGVFQPTVKVGGHFFELKTEEGCVEKAPSARDAWVKLLIDSIDSMDVEAFTAFLTEDVCFRFGNAEPVSGKVNVGDAVSGFFESIAALQHNVLATIEQGNVVICHGAVTYTRHDSSTLTVPFANVLKLRGDLIMEYLIYIDISDLYK
jgi:hypothetical protein